MSSNNILEVLPDYWYKMDEASGSTARDTGYSGTALDGSTTGATPAESMGRTLGYLFDADSEYVDCGNIPFASKADCTIILRYKQTGTLTSTRALFMAGKNLAGTYGIGIIIISNVMQVVIADKDSATATFTQNVSIDFDDDFTHTIAITQDGTNSLCSVYIDGRFYVSFATDTALHASIDSSYIGDFPYGTSASYRGGLKDVRVYWQVLNARQIKNITFKGYWENAFGVEAQRNTVWNATGNAAEMQGARKGQNFTLPGTQTYSAGAFGYGFQGTTGGQDTGKIDPFYDWNYKKGSVSFMVKKTTASITHTAMFFYAEMGASRFVGTFMRLYANGSKLYMTAQSALNVSYSTGGYTTGNPVSGWSVGALHKVQLSWDSDAGFPSSKRMVMSIDGVDEPLSLLGNTNWAASPYDNLGGDGLLFTGGNIDFSPNWRLNEFLCDNFQLNNEIDLDHNNVYSERPTIEGVFRYPQERLIYWNKLGSVAEAGGNPMGLPATETGTVLFDTGRFGNGCYTSSTNKFEVADISDLTPAAFALEIWLTTRTATPVTPGQFLFYFGDDVGFGFTVSVSAGAFIVDVFDYANIGTDRANYSWAIGTAWNSSGVDHHIGIACDAAGGLGGVGNGRIAIYSDNVQQTPTVVSARDTDWTGSGTTEPDRPSKLYIANHRTASNPTTDLTINNLKIWNYSKTDFKARNIFEPIDMKELSL